MERMQEGGPSETLLRPIGVEVILFLTDSAPDYGADYLYDGFCCLYGPENVVEWPRKWNLHRPCGEQRVFDCDSSWPASGLMSELQANLFKGWSAVVVPSLRCGQAITSLKSALAFNQEHLVYYDAEDHNCDTLAQFVALAGVVPAAYFKRELPIGATWAKPLPFGYPGYRITPPTAMMRKGAVYAAHIWEWARGGMRETLADILAKDDRVTVNASRTSGDRLTVEQYHSMNRRALVAVVPAGLGSQTNRHLEVVADGCCPIIERLTVQWPDFFVEGKECLMFSTAEECAQLVSDALKHPDKAMEMAERAQRKLIEKHTTLARARTVMEAIGG